MKKADHNDSLNKGIKASKEKTTGTSAALNKSKARQRAIADIEKQPKTLQ